MKDERVNFIKLQNGSSDEFKKLFNKYNSAILGYFIKRLPKDLETAEDLAQAFWSMMIVQIKFIDFQKLLEPYFRGIRNDFQRLLEPYFYGACNKMLMDHLRRKYREEKAMEKVKEHTVHEPVDTEAKLTKTFDRIDNLSARIKRLSQKDQKVLYLFYFEGLKTAEIAVKLNYSIDYVPVLLCKIRAKLRSM